MRSFDKTLAVVVLLLLCSTFIKAGEAKREVKMVFYMHDIPTSPNATAVVVAAANGSFSKPFGLGVT